MPEARIPKGRSKLVAVIKAAGDIIEIEDVVQALAISRADAAKMLSRWTRQGWMRRVGPGAYVQAPLDSLESEHVLGDPWILVPTLYAPAYIGGRTAAEHWDLTEQLFRDIVVMTTQTVRDRKQDRHGTHFTLHHIQERKIFGTKTVWRGRTKVPVSDVHRTIIDMLDNPAIGGGIRHVADCFDEYIKRDDRNEDVLIANAERLGNGAVFKRLGFLAEKYPDLTALAEDCRMRLTKGNSKLDPMLQADLLISRWRLWVPASWVKGGTG